MKKYVAAFSVTLAVVAIASVLRGGNQSSQKAIESIDSIAEIRKEGRTAKSGLPTLAIDKPQAVVAAPDAYQRLAAELEKPAYVESPPLSASANISVSYSGSAYQANPGYMNKEMVSDLKQFLDVEKREQQFLRKTVGVSEEKYREIRDERKRTDNLLRRAKVYADRTGADYDRLQELILSKHVEWMQASIGYGYYEKLQEVSDPGAD